MLSFVIYKMSVKLVFEVTLIIRNMCLWPLHCEIKANSYWKICPSFCVHVSASHLVCECSVDSISLVNKEKKTFVFFTVEKERISLLIKTWLSHCFTFMYLKEILLLQMNLLSRWSLYLVTPKYCMADNSWLAQLSLSKYHLQI